MDFTTALDTIDGGSRVTMLIFKDFYFKITGPLRALSLVDGCVKTRLCKLSCDV